MAHLGNAEAAPATAQGETASTLKYTLVGHWAKNRCLQWLTMRPAGTGTVRGAAGTQASRATRCAQTGPP